VAFGLAAIAYIPNVEQSQNTLTGINQMMSIWPALLTLIALVAILFYKLTEKKYGEIVKELEERRKSIKQTA